MLQTLFHIPHEIGGVPMFGIGLLLGVLVVGTLSALAWLWHTRKSLADARGFLPVVLMIGAAIVFLLPMLEEAREGLPIRGYGVMMLLGVVCGVGLAAWRAPSARFDPEVIYALAFWMFVAGIVGARLFHVIEYWEQSYRQPTLGATLAAIVNVPRGGLVVYGSLIAVMIMLPWFVWKHKLPGLALCDLVAPSMVLGLALGRIGCLLNGCCYGGESDIPWAITFPANSLPYRDQRQAGRLDDVKLALDAEGRVVAKRVLGDAARKTGLKDGDAIAAIEGKIDGVPIRLELGTSPRIDVAPTSLEGKSGTELVALASDVAPWLKRQQRLLDGGEAKDQLAVARHLLETLSYPDVRMETADGRQLFWQLPARSLPVQPAQLYSTIDAALICIFLLAYSPYRRHDGEVFALLLTIYPITRFLIEIIRVDEPGQFGTQLSISQLVSFGVLAGVAVFWVYLLSKPAGGLWATSGLGERSV